MAPFDPVTTPSDMRACDIGETIVHVPLFVSYASTVAVGWFPAASPPTT